MTRLIGCRCKSGNTFSQAVLIGRAFWLVVNDYYFKLEINYGGYTRIAPPVPIPNTEVKYPKADDSGLPRK
jgi:hypothetical protein